MENILAALKEQIIVADGAMGTLLYSKGVFINRCYDELNLTEPNLIREIHREYLQAGAQILETNTFGANPFKLQPHGLGEKCGAINERGAQLAKEVAGKLAWVGGSIGPLGTPLSPLGKISIEEARDLFRPQVRGLLDGGVDFFVLETFSDVSELNAAVQAIRQESTLPILAMATFPAEGRTLLGYIPDEVVTVLTTLGVEMIGANCSQGPHDMLPTIERFHQIAPDLPLAAMPNAGNPKFHEGRVLYLTSPDYMGEYARRFLQAGAKILGGCCGTTPAHIRAIKSMVKMQQPTIGRAIKSLALTAADLASEPVPLEKAKTVEPLPVHERSPLGAKIAGRSLLGHKFIVSVEMNPPRGHDVNKIMADAEKLRFEGVDVVNIPDGPRATARMGALHIASLIQQWVGMETVLHYTCRDRNLLGMQADLLGAYAMGLRNILAITGDPPKMGNYPHATAVYDVESIGLVRVLDGLNRGVDLAATPLEKPTSFLIGVGVSPGAPDFARELQRFRYKVEAGANFCMTQPVFEPALLVKFLEATKDIHIPVLVGILPLASYRNAEFLHHEVPGMQIPEAIRERMRFAGAAEAQREEGIKIAQEALLATKHLVQGVYVMPPFGRIDLALRLLEVLK